MASDRSDRLPPGRQPYDPLNGARVGALAGAILGAVVTAVTSIGFAWLVLVLAAAGGALGFWLERRSLRSASRDLGEPGGGG